MKTTKLKRYCLPLMALALVMGCSKKDPPPIEDAVTNNEHEFYDEEMDNLLDEDIDTQELNPLDEVSTQSQPPKIQQDRWVIRYVKDAGETYADRDGSEATGSVNRGDILVVELDGEWAVTADGLYVKAEILSDKAIGRQRSGGQWGSP